MGETAEVDCEHRKADYVDECVRVLRDSGARITGPRRAVIGCLAEAERPLSCREVLERIDADPELSSIDQVSVYRILDTLQELGLVHRVYPSGDFMACLHSSCGHVLHVIARCTVCERSSEMEVPQQLFSPFSWFMAQERAFRLQGHLLQVDGVCSECD